MLHSVMLHTNVTAAFFTSQMSQTLSGTVGVSVTHVESATEMLCAPGCSLYYTAPVVLKLAVAQ